VFKKWRRPFTLEIGASSVGASPIGVTATAALEEEASCFGFVAICMIEILEKI